MTLPEIRELIKQELPTLIREDPEIRELILRLSRQEFAPKQQTEDRFDRILSQMERDREMQSRRWEEHLREETRKWEENTLKWNENQAELRRMREESERKWSEQRKESERKWSENQAELQRMREESERKWSENQAELQHMRGESERKWSQQREESERKFEEHRREFNRVHEEIMKLALKHDRTVGALGARWGLSSEKAFRDALASVLESNFGVRVLNINDYDEQGTVFGRPEQIELDVIVTNGTLIVMELKSSIDKAGMYIFERKARFYEQRHHRRADRLIVISPMIDPKARQVGERLGIEMFGDSVQVESL